MAGDDWNDWEWKIEPGKWKLGGKHKLVTVLGEKKNLTQRSQRPEHRGHRERKKRILLVKELGRTNREEYGTTKREEKERI